MTVWLQSVAHWQWLVIYLAWSIDSDSRLTEPAIHPSSYHSLKLNQTPHSRLLDCWLLLVDIRVIIVILLYTSLSFQILILQSGLTNVLLVSLNSALVCPVLGPKLHCLSLTSGMARWEPLLGRLTYVRWWQWTVDTPETCVGSALSNNHAQSNVPWNGSPADFCRRSYRHTFESNCQVSIIGWMIGLMLTKSILFFDCGVFFEFRK